ncbi:MAG: RT0821/Lpp0805 family surface protein [Hyphomicrobiales bacterium]|nr:RT0821/Lpp0805 family surface protein [Alphaproteobacteria bacterium]
MLALGVGGSLGGCAVSGSLGSMFNKAPRDEARAAYTGDETTASVVKLPATSATPAAAASGLPADTDLVFARMAIVEVLTRGAKQISSPWENPSNGAHGTVTPIASIYVRDGATCRDFLASYVGPHSPETWMQGQACRGKQGPWEVRSLRPWTSRT